VSGVGEQGERVRREAARDLDQHKSEYDQERISQNGFI